MDGGRMRSGGRMVRDFVDRLRFAWSELTPWASAVLVALTVSWAADGLMEIFEAFLKGEAMPGWMMVTSAAYVVTLWRRWHGFIVCGVGSSSLERAFCATKRRKNGSIWCCFCRT